MTNRFIATTFAVLLQTTAFAGAADEKIMGWGGYFCSRWIDDHPKTAASWLELSDTGRSQAQWVLGYLQGNSRLPDELYYIKKEAGVKRRPP